MSRRWRIALPCIGLSLFMILTYSSLRMNREIQRSPSRYFWWQSIRLDSDPLNRYSESATTPCKNGAGNCWELRDTWVDPGFLARFFMLSALPAFVIGAAVVRGLARLGVSEIWSFTMVIPLLIVVWFYFVGRLIDRWVNKRSHPRAQTPV
jgi:hypothetical protein